MHSKMSNSSKNMEFLFLQALQACNDLLRLIEIYVEVSYQVA